jgi:hypothetical protein
MEAKGDLKDSEQDPLNYDISTPCWFYLDSNSLKQGPFSFKEMFLWWKGGYFPSELNVRTIWEAEFQPLGNIPEFYKAPPKLVERIEKEQEDLVKQGHIEIPLVPTFYEKAEEELDTTAQPLQTPDFKNYAVKGSFNALTGKFQGADGKGPSDRESKMMSHYFDHEAYQRQMQEAAAAKKKKIVKGTKKFWKERKEKKKRAKLIAEYLAD